MKKFFLALLLAASAACMAAQVAFADDSGFIAGEFVDDWLPGFEKCERIHSDGG